LRVRRLACVIASRARHLTREKLCDNPLSLFDVPVVRVDIPREFKLEWHTLPLRFDSLSQRLSQMLRPSFSYYLGSSLLQNIPLYLLSLKIYCCLFFLANAAHGVECASFYVLGQFQHQRSPALSAIRIQAIVVSRERFTMLD